jgi:5'-3' exoribonuclease 1
MIEASVKEEYFSSRDIVKALNISPSLLGKIVGSLYIDKIDAGLNLKRSGQYFLLGYVREVVPPGSSNQAWGNAKDSVRVIGSIEEGAAGDASAAMSSSSSWEYSAKAVALILEYKQQFPQLFNALEHLPHEKKYSSNQIWGPGSGAKIQLVKLDEWLNAQFTAKAARTPLSTLSLSRDAIKAVERAADVRTAHLSATPPEKLVVKKVPLEAVYRVRVRVRVA